MTERSVRVLLEGSVQGRGVRPALARLAAQRGWLGSVRNTISGVELSLSGAIPDDVTLVEQIGDAVPCDRDEYRLSVESVSHCGQKEFLICESSTTGLLTAPIPRDVAICAECLAEFRNPRNRRYGYSLISCAACGPRYSILTAMPFDRATTSMSKFIPCDQCRSEYENPLDRRFHAQTICCSQCGPQVWASDSAGVRLAVMDDAIRLAVATLKKGGIVAMRGVGGYQLLVDATSSAAVAELRGRKQRLVKPFAVLCKSVEAARELAIMNDAEEQQITSRQNPIVLLRQRSDVPLAPNVNPDLSDIGILLPTTALHERMAELAQVPLVCTSGNVEGEMLASRVDEAVGRLRDVADLFVHHDRDIMQPIDDSVVRVMANRAVTIRCARGLAPLPLPSPENVAPCIALGAHQKAAVALSNGRQSLLGPHVGDLDTVSAREGWCERLVSLSQLNAVASVTTTLVARDKHPGYFSTRWSDDLIGDRKSIWHHHAHIVSGMVEHNWLGRTVLGVAFDGTGLGPDGTIWGGEFLISSTANFERVASLRPFGLPGGDVAMIDLRRTTVSMLSELDVIDHDMIEHLSGMQRDEVRRIQEVAHTEWTVKTTSCGRLFDVAACLILGRTRSEADGHAAMCLEAACDSDAAGFYEFRLQEAETIEIDWRPVLMQIIEDRRSGTEIGVMATRFHRGLAQIIVSVCQRWPELPVILSGGVFQNRVLVEMILDAWPTDRSAPGLPGSVPPNDGGISVGQLFIASNGNSEGEYL